MPIQFAPGNFAPGTSSGSFLEGFGQSINKGLGSVLEQQAEQQLYNLNQQRAEKHYASQAQQLAPFLQGQNLPEGFADLLVRQPQFATQLIKQQQQQALAQQEGNLFRSLMGITGAVAEEAPQQTATGGVSGIPKKNLGASANMTGNKIQIPESTPLKPGQAIQLANLFKQQEQQNRANKIAQERLELEKKKEEAVNDRFIKKAEKEKEKEEYKQSKLDERLDTKQTEKYYDATLSEADAAKRGDLRLTRFEHLIKKGSLPVAAWYNILKKAEEGGGLNAIPLVGPLAGTLLKFATEPLRALQKNVTSRDTEEYEKLQTDFIRDAKGIFGSRVTDFDLESFMKMIPTLSNTDAGKGQIIKNMRTFNQLVKKKAEVMKDIIKENKGKRPANLRILVDERMAPELDKAAEDFKAGTLNTLFG